MKIITVKGMTCEHCARAVKDSLEEIGLTNINVDLKDGVVTFDENDTPVEILRNAIDDVGYTLV